MTSHDEIARLRIVKAAADQVYAWFSVYGPNPDAQAWGMEDCRNRFRALRDALSEVDAPTRPPTTVPYGHCNRCERCGWPHGSKFGGCLPGDCSQRPLPPLRSSCAGCGAPFEETSK